MQQDSEAAGENQPAADHNEFPERWPAGAGAHRETGTGEDHETGEPRVDEAIAGLGGLAGRPVDEHVAVFEDTHARLRQVLSELDSGPPGAAGP
jgi:hypothetical protein